MDHLEIKMPLVVLAKRSFTGVLGYKRGFHELISQCPNKQEEFGGQMCKMGRTFCYFPRNNVANLLQRCIKGPGTLPWRFSKDIQSIYSPGFSPVVGELGTETFLPVEWLGHVIQEGQLIGHLHYPTHQ